MDDFKGLENAIKDFNSNELWQMAGDLNDDVEGESFLQEVLNKIERSSDIQSDFSADIDNDTLAKRLNRMDPLLAEVICAALFAVREGLIDPDDLRKDPKSIIRVCLEFLKSDKWQLKSKFNTDELQEIIRQGYPETCWEF